MSLHPRTEALLARVADAVDADGRLALPDVAGWDIFPFEGEVLVKRLAPPVVPEPERHGAGGVGCESCDAGAAGAIWSDGRWKLVAPAPASIPIVLLSPLDHLDYHELDDTMAAELGVRSVQVERSLTSLGGVGRVHVMKVGDGAEHLHVWFLARPEGVLQLRGSSLSDWSDCLPAMPVQEWDGIMSQLAAAMAVHGGRAYV